MLKSAFAFVAAIGIVVLTTTSPAAAVVRPHNVGSINFGAPKYFSVNLRPGSTRADAIIVGNYFRKFGLIVDDHSTDVVFVHGTYAQVGAAAHAGFELLAMNGSPFAHTANAPAFPRDIADRILATTLDDGPPLQRGLSAPDFTLEPKYGFSPSQMATFYDAASVYSGGDTGQGENIAVIDCGEANGQALTDYDHFFGLPALSWSVVYLDGGTNQITNIASSDVEAINGVAPGASITEYVLPASCTLSQFADALAKIGTDMATKHYVAVSDDYSASEDFYDATGMDSTLQAEHANIQSIANAGGLVVSETGLWGAGAPQSEYTSAGEITVEYPSSDPLALGVGGTSAIPNSDFTRNFEPAWGGSGGGVSHEFTIPKFQKGLAGEASTTFRNVPDVSYDGDENTCIELWLGLPRQHPTPACIAGTGSGVGAWAAIVALVDEARVAANKKPIKNFLNTLYAQKRNGIFVPIQRGCNDYYCSGTKIYNNVTGLGVPDVAKLVSAFAALP